MFTGIIQAVGEIADMQPSGGDMRLRINTGKLDLSDVDLGDSIAANGACLTVVELPGDGYWADVSVETLNFTTLGGLKTGSKVNLEKALTPASRLGGHIVSGHVDGVGEVVSLQEDARSWRFVMRAPDDLAKYIAHKGSITVDGTSLTVNAVNGAEFDLNIIPQTMAETVFGDYQPGSKLNLEVDVIARYLERLMQGDGAAKPGAGSISMQTLAENGYT
ncbi:riboflavin synthase [Halieaceae bacterium IMCC8485]|jgi:riboflavin synthase|uniref:Riboflavin synthase n=1 Tax=Candidatus Seongchinamella marina TaxID=2518990 RepID=A0ABT3T081_9GAMM|nr:riboflavin synthase [Candidatus Seongchinamella marina]MBT6124615.1 riboflavin synthase [Halieaceae bacterium]MCX2975666.1 riboflavin synthase [Candidatus Seongchinamella marina]